MYIVQILCVIRENEPILGLYRMKTKRRFGAKPKSVFCHSDVNEFSQGYNTLDTTQNALCTC